LLGAPISGVDQVAGDVDTQYVRAEARRRQRRRAFAAAEVWLFVPGADAEAAGQPLAAPPHGRRDPCEVAFFPESLIWIHVVTSELTVGERRPTRQWQNGQPSEVNRT